MNSFIRNMWRSALLGLCLTGVASAGAATLALSPSGTASGVSSTLVFVDTNTGAASLPQTVTLTAGGGAVSLHALGMSDANFTLVKNGTCFGTGGIPAELAVLASGATCTFDVKFTPVSAGWHSGTVTISSDATNAPPPVVYLQGNGTAILQTIGALTFSPTSLTFGGGTVTVSANGGASGNPVVFSSTTTGVCTVAGNTVSIVSAGNCVVAADQAAGNGYAAATQVTGTLTINKAPQAISTLTFSPNSIATGGTTVVSATGGASGNPVTFASTTASICTTGGTNGSTVTYVATGTCGITANQAGNTNYSAAQQVSGTVATGVNPQAKLNQTISFGAAPTVAAGGTGSMSATATSGLSVTFSTGSTACSVTSAGVVTGITAGGTCYVVADQAGNATYNAASQAAQAFTIASASTTVSVAGCSTTATTIKDWGWPAVGITEAETLLPGQTLAIRFHTGTTAVVAGFGTVETLIAPGAAERYAAISTCPGDFGQLSTSSTLTSTPYCYVDGTPQTANVNLYVGSYRYYCGLAPDTTYYFNIRHANPAIVGQPVSPSNPLSEMCTVASGCGFLLQFSHN